MQGGANSNEVTIQAVAFPKVLGFNDLVVVLKIFWRNLNDLLRCLLAFWWICWMFFSVCVCVCFCCFCFPECFGCFGKF